MNGSTKIAYVGGRELYERFNKDRLARQQGTCLIATKNFQVKKVQNNLFI